MGSQRIATLAPQDIFSDDFRKIVAVNTKRNSTAGIEMNGLVDRMNELYKVYGAVLFPLLVAIRS